MFKLKYFLLISVLVIFDLLVYLFLGISMMGYEDNYIPSKGEFNSWESMSRFDKSVTVVLSFWNLANVVAILYIGYKIYKKVKSKKLQLYGSNQNNHH